MRSKKNNYEDSEDEEIFKQEDIFKIQALQEKDHGYHQEAEKQKTFQKYENDIIYTYDQEFFLQSEEPKILLFQSWKREVALQFQKENLKEQLYIFQKWNFASKTFPKLNISPRHVIIKQKFIDQITEKDYNLFDMFSENQHILAFDIDYKTQYDKEKYLIFLSHQKTFLLEIINMLQIPEKFQNNFIICDSTRENKISFHIYNPKVVINDSQRFKKMLSNYILKHVEGEFKTLYLQNVDLSLYSKSHYLRSIGQSKPENMIPLTCSDKKIKNSMILLADINKQDQYIPDIQMNNQAIIKINLQQQEQKIQKHINKNLQNQNPKNQNPENNNQLLDKYRDRFTKLMESKIISTQPITKDYYLQNMQQENSILQIVLANKRNYSILKDSFLCVCGNTHDNMYLLSFFDLDNNSLTLYCKKNNKSKIYQNFDDQFKYSNQELENYVKNRDIEYLVQQQERFQMEELKNKFSDQKNNLKYKYMFFKLPCGGGKTHNIFKYFIPNHCKKVLYITYRRSMKNDIIDRYKNNGYSIYDYEENKDFLYYDLEDVQEKLVLICQYNSLQKVYNFSQYDTIIFDECQSLRNILPSDQLLCSVLRNGVCKWQKLIFLDALLNVQTIEFYRTLFIDALRIRDDEIIIFENAPKKNHTHYHVEPDAKNKKLDIAYSILKQFPQDAFTIALESKNLLQKLKKTLLLQLKVPEQQILCLYGDQEEAFKKQTIRQINQYVEEANIKYFLYTSTITVGVSLDLPKFQKHINIFDGKYLRKEDHYQMTFRSRFAQTFFHICDQKKLQGNIKKQKIQIQNFEYLKYNTNTFVNLQKILDQCSTNYLEEFKLENFVPKKEKADIQDIKEEINIDQKNKILTLAENNERIFSYLVKNFNILREKTQQQEINLDVKNYSYETISSLVKFIKDIKEDKKTIEQLFYLAPEYYKQKVQDAQLSLSDDQQTQHKKTLKQQKKQYKIYEKLKNIYDLFLKNIQRRNGYYFIRRENLVPFIKDQKMKRTNILQQLNQYQEGFEKQIFFSDSGQTVLNGEKQYIFKIQTSKKVLLMSRLIQNPKVFDKLELQSSLRKLKNKN